MTFSATNIDKLCIDTVRCLAMDAVQKANSGHPGTPMAQAPAAYVLWTRFLKHHPANPLWPDRDRFVLSCGHVSMLLYSLLHLTGYDLSLEDIKQFRQWGSRTPGHPEFGHTAGVETTTGPLGQGIGNAVGMAIAERWLAERFNQPGFEVVNHRTFVFAGDGDLMEGVAQEAASLAGHLALDKLVLLYDSNRITIEGSTGLAFTEDVAKRFEGYGWRVLRVSDGEDLAALASAYEEACRPCGKPTLIVCRTIIGFPAPTKQNTAAAHGAPLGEAEIRATKEILGWDPDAKFLVPAEALAHWRQCETRGAGQEAAWIELLAQYRAAHPGRAAEFEAMLLEVLSDFQITIPELGTIGASSRPAVVLTSNNSRELTEALKRRCLYLWLDYPQLEHELAIVRLHAPELSETVARKLIEIVGMVRELDLKTPPSIAESIDWARALLLLGVEDIDAESFTQTMSVIVKHRTDVELVAARVGVALAAAS